MTSLWLEETGMRVGVTKEIKNHDYRLGLTPNGAATLVRTNALAH